MLPRAARSKTKFYSSRTIASSFERLQLPWLCPALFSYLEQFRKSSSTPSSKRSPRPRSQTQNLLPDIHAHIRRLATAAEFTNYRPSEEYVPFEGLDLQWQTPGGQRPWTDSVATLKPFNTSNLIIVPQKTSSMAPLFKRARNSSITGDVMDLQQNLYACVRVGRLDRAAALIRRLAQLYHGEAPEMQDAHHQYLLGLLDALLLSPSTEKFMAMQKWFELDLRGRDVVPNGAILSIMLKASLQVLDGTRLDRTIRRYMQLAQQLGPQVEDDTLSSAIFRDSEWSRIVRLFPRKYEAPTEEISASDLPEIKPSMTDNAAPFAPTLEAVLANNAVHDEALPELRAAQQKGLGLKTLRRSLLSMSPNFDSPEPNADRETALTLLQERLEQDVLTSALERWREEAEATQDARSRGILSDPLLGSYMHEWISAMISLLQEEIKLSDAAEARGANAGDADRLLLAPFLRLIPPEKLCAATVLSYLDFVTTCKRSGAVDHTILSMIAKLGQKLAYEMRAERNKSSLMESLNDLPSAERRRKLGKLTKSRGMMSTNKILSGVKRSVDSSSGDPHNDDELLSTTIRVKMGAMLLSLFMKVAKIPVTTVDSRNGEKVTEVQPVATHSWKWHHGKQIGIIKTNPGLIKRLKKEPVMSFIAKLLPMIVEPKKWNNITVGPYLKSEVSAVRFRDTSRSQQAYMKMAVQRGDMNQVLAGLDIISKVPWRVNEPVFRVLLEAWNTGEAIGGLAPENPVPVYPLEPDSSDFVAHNRWKQIVKSINNEATGYHSQRCYQNFQLEVARSYLETTFYCPHNVDFRGRAYPIPPYFNHMGADHVRGLFLFAKGQPLGDHGLRWLKIHLANVYGYDKESLTDRESFAMDHLTDIYDSAENPMTGKRWWLTSEDAWQCLAACIELRNALNSPVPSDYISHLPIQQDGTCNGLQHYAALGGDEIGARQVNLMPGDRPADIYSAVANMVKEEVVKDAAKGVKEAQVLDGNITRKVVKQPVMTNVYGVTYHGARRQVKRQLVDILPKATVDNDIQYSKLSAYVATHIFGSLAKMFDGAHAIQKWLGECGGRISQAVTPEQIHRIQQRRSGNLGKDTKFKKKQLRLHELDAVKEDYQFKSTIVWTTPLGMPVVQPYRALSMKLIHTNLQDIYVMDGKLSDPVSKRKQLQAFPPNFIHSLDATHMMLTALKCDELGLTFAAVHDSFWTHAGSVPVMNRVIRDAFVRMHSEDIIGRLREEFVARYKGCFYFAPIKLKTPLAKAVQALRQSKGRTTASFARAGVRSKHPLDELLEEFDRKQLLDSDDPDKQKQGREMITPYSLYEAEADPDEVHFEGDTVQLLGDQQPDGLVDSAMDEVDAEADGDVDHISEFPVSDLAEDSFVEPKADGVTAENQVADDTTPTAKPAKPKRESGVKNIYVWVPMTFPPAPKKGTFDVTQLKDSQYFFS